MLHWEEGEEEASNQEERMEEEEALNQRREVELALTEIRPD